MEQYNNYYKWSQAAAKGLVLAGVTIVFTAITYISTNNWINAAVQLARTIVCIWLLCRLMKEYHITTGSSPMGFALATVLFSSIICAFFDAASYMWFFPELKSSVEATFNELLAQIPEEGQAIMEDVMDGMPKWTLIVNFIKDFLFGLITSAIMNSTLNKTKSIFDGNGNGEEEDELA